MSDEQKPGDPANRAVDGAFLAWVTSHPIARLASGEEALLLAEIDRLRDDLQKQADWADWAKGEIDRLERILAALREPSEKVLSAVRLADKLGAGYGVQIPAAVAAAEQEVGRDL